MALMELPLHKQQYASSVAKNKLLRIPFFIQDIARALQFLSVSRHVDFFCVCFKI